jgi:transposase
MPLPPPFRLSDADKDALLAQQQDMIERLVARITELEALVGKPRKTSVNSHISPSKDEIGRDRKRRNLSRCWPTCTTAIMSGSSVCRGLRPRCSA